MPVPSTVITAVAALQNDAAQNEYTNAAVLPYFNMALRDLQKQFQLNAIPSTKEVSAALTVPASTDIIAFSGTTPTLPANLIEIQRLWESDESLDDWITVIKKDFIPHYIENTQISKFLIWLEH